MKIASSTLSALLLCCIMALVASCCSLQVPREYKNYLRNKVGTKVVAITQNQFSRYREGSGGGTGFHVRAPSGKVYIMTNRHVCDDAKDGKMWVTIDRLTQDRQLKVLEMSDRADLCLMEAIPGISGLEIADPPRIDDEVVYIGHPRLQGRTYVTGELVGTRQLSVPRGQIGKEISEEECKKSKDSYIEEVPEVYMVLRRFKRDTAPDGLQQRSDLDKYFDTSKKVRVCYERGLAWTTTLSVYGGASGSPVVNMDGDVVGVIYAGSDGEWGYAVPLSEVNRLLKGK